MTSPTSSWVITFLTLISLCCSSAHRRGHGLKLGNHRPPIGHVDIVTRLPTPVEFWERYGSRRQPVVFKGAASHSLGMHRWTDDYLARNYGNLKVKIESKAEKESSPAGARGLGQDTIGSFLATYRSRNAYIVSQLPEPMAGEVSVLPFLTCGTLRERILEANLWMSSGGTRSLLHRDADNAINCLYAGTKDWILIDPSFEDRIPIAKENVEAYGGYSLLDPESVDLDKYPAFSSVEWSYANISAGDCLFLPYGYWHQVRSYGSRNIAVSVLFSRLTEVDLSSCRNGDLHFTPLDEVGMVYTYDGFGDQTMGNMDPFELNETLGEWCQSVDAFNLQTLTAALIKGKDLDSAELSNHIDPWGTTGPDDASAADFIQSVTPKMMTLLDTDHDGRLDCPSELMGLSLSTLKTLANLLDGDSANTELHEYVSFTPDQIRSLLMACMKHAETYSNGEIAQRDFLKSYMKLGGSRQGGQQVFSLLDQERDGFISKDELHNNIKRVTRLYTRRQEQRTNRLSEDEHFRDEL